MTRIPRCTCVRVRAPRRSAPRGLSLPRCQPPPSSRWTWRALPLPPAPRRRPRQGRRPPRRPRAAACPPTSWSCGQTENKCCDSASSPPPPASRSTPPCTPSTRPSPSPATTCRWKSWRSTRYSHTRGLETKCPPRRACRPATSGLARAARAPTSRTGATLPTPSRTRPRTCTARCTCSSRTTATGSRCAAYASARSTPPLRASNGAATSTPRWAPASSCGPRTRQRRSSA